MTSVPVLMYHHVAPDREVTPEGFAAQLDWLAANGYRTLGSLELIDHLAGRAPVQGRAVALTFDDGYADNWIYAYPALKSRGLTAHVFPVTERVTDGPARPTAEEGGSLADTVSAERAPAGFLTWEELRRMSGSGVFEVGSHTHTHRGFVRHERCDIVQELKRSRNAIESRLGTWPGTIAWPWGDYQESWLELLPDAGYRLAFTTAPGSNHAGADPLRVARFKVRNTDTAWLSRRLLLHSSSALVSTYGIFYRMSAWTKR